MDSEVLFERDGPILIITLNRPESRNAMSLGMTEAIGLAIEAADHDPAIRAIVMIGAGEQAFCAGADLKALAEGKPYFPADPRRAQWGFAGVTGHPISKPIIAAVNGAALGGGCELVLACDIAIASTTARFGLPEVTRGMLAGAGGVFRMVRQLPAKVAMELLLTGNTLSADEALAHGLVSRVVSQDALRPTALDIARQIAAHAPLAVQATKRVARGIVGGTIPDEMLVAQLASIEGQRLMESDDAREGPRAFAEKRKPVWQGR